jgi:hypothetical protein
MLAASAAEIDGRWAAEATPRNQKAAAARNNSFTLELATTPDGKVTGTVSVAGKKKPRTQTIQNAKLDGNRLNFTTMQTTKKAEVKFSWQVTVDGARMSGTRTRDGAKHGVPIKARKTA